MKGNIKVIVSCFITLLSIAVIIIAVSAKNKSEEELESMKHEVNQLRNDLATQKNELPPEILDISFTNEVGENLVEDGWVIPGTDGKVQINIQLKGDTSSIDLIMTPTGTDTYLLQQVVATIYVDKGQETVNYTWEVPKGTLAHIWLIAYHNNIGRKSDTFNVYRE